MRKLFYSLERTPWTELLIASSDRGLAAIHFVRDGGKRASLLSLERMFAGEDLLESPQENRIIASELEAYAQGELREFTVPLDLRGPPFQRAVWRALLKIPYGETRSYAAIAQAVGKPGAFRAVGGANHSNPIPIVVPCHRVIGSDGRLVGYGGGLDLKKALLEHERRHAPSREGTAPGSTLLLWK
jgi:O-6-methylguanine DNA methyltransferase